MSEVTKSIEEKAADALYEKTYKPSCGNCQTCTKGIIRDKTEPKLIQINK